MARYGAPPEVVKRWQARKQSDVYQVLAEAWPALEVFLACNTQWRFAGMAAVPIGLDYGGVRAALALMRRRPSADLFADLRIMESAALVVLRQRRRSS